MLYRLKRALSESGSSLTVTSLTAVLGFAFGAIVPIPGVRAFCTFSALAFLLSFIFQFLLFVPHFVKVEKRLYEERNAFIPCIYGSFQDGEVLSDTELKTANEKRKREIAMMGEPSPNNNNHNDTTNVNEKNQKNGYGNYLGTTNNNNNNRHELSASNIPSATGTSLQVSPNNMFELSASITAAGGSMTSIVTDDTDGIQHAMYDSQTFNNLSFLNLNGSGNESSYDRHHQSFCVHFMTRCMNGCFVRLFLSSTICSTIMRCVCILCFLAMSGASVYSSIIIKADQGTTDHLSDGSYYTKFFKTWDKYWSGTQPAFTPYIMTKPMLYDETYMSTLSGIITTLTSQYDFVLGWSNTDWLDDFGTWMTDRNNDFYDMYPSIAARSDSNEGVYDQYLLLNGSELAWAVNIFLQQDGYEDYSWQVSFDDSDDPNQIDACMISMVYAQAGMLYVMSTLRL